jgi:hypothetical protein
MKSIDEMSDAEILIECANYMAAKNVWNDSFIFMQQLIQTGPYDYRNESWGS